MAAKNRAVFVSQRFPPDKGGNAARIHDVTTHLDDGWDVTVLAPPPSYPPGEFDRSWQRKQTDSVDGVTTHRLWTWQPMTENPGMLRRLPYYLLFSIHAMFWLVWNVRRYDAVVTTTPPISTGAAGLCASVLGKPWIVDVRDLWIDAAVSLGYLDEGSFLERASRRFQRLVLHTADGITVTTELLGEYIQELYGESLAEKTLLISNGVDVDRFQPPASRVSDDSTAAAVPENRQDAAATAGPKPDGGRSTIIYTGNLGSSQALGPCIRAMAHLEHDAAVLKLIGAGDMKSELRQLRDDLGLADRVEFHGLVPRAEVPALLADATIGIAPLQDSEEMAYAMPTKLYEYLASGLPTVVTGRGEIERFIDASGGGFHVENDPEQIAAKFDELLADEQLREQLGRDGRAYVEANCDRKAIANRLSKKLSELVE